MATVVNSVSNSMTTTNNTVESISLLSDSNRVMAPFIKITIGAYTFGVYNKSSDGNGNYFPNYVYSLSIKKINGSVNTYTLVLHYAVTATNDPNYIEKILSSVSESRSIIFSYGDFSVPEYIYKDESALITKVNSNVDIKSNVISYTIVAVSSSLLSLNGNYSFIKKRIKPSDEIKNMLKQNDKYGLLNIFTGFKNLSDYSKVIASDDKIVDLEAKPSMSVLDYLYYLVSCMVPMSSTNKTTNTVYTLTTVDDTTGVYGGSYFTVKKVQTNTNTLNTLSMYTIDIGYPSANLVTQFNIKNDQSYSILYEYNNDLNVSDYGKRIDDNGNISYVNAPPLTSDTQLHLNTQADITWWSKITSFPISVDLTITGLLRPAILMSYVKLNVWFFGRKHISSGYYIITAQTDNITMSDGFTTNLSLVRIAPDDDSEAALGLFGETKKTDDSSNADVNASVSISGGTINKISNSTLHQSSSGVWHGGGTSSWYTGTSSNYGIKGGSWQDNKLLDNIYANKETTHEALVKNRDKLDSTVNVSYDNAGVYINKK